MTDNEVELEFFMADVHCLKCVPARLLCRLGRKEHVDAVVKTHYEEVHHATSVKHKCRAAGTYP